MIEPDWLLWARRLQAIAQSGLTFVQDPYDKDRYEQIRALAAEIMAARSGGNPARIEGLFAEQSGYATPKVDVRAAAFGKTAHS
jgi:hydrolase of X-linked nucleoside diphosphate